MKTFPRFDTGLELTVVELIRTLQLFLIVIIRVNANQTTKVEKVFEVNFSRQLVLNLI